MISRLNLPLRWRITTLTALLITVLSIITAAITFAVVSSSLLSDVQQGLRADAERVAQRYRGEASGEAQIPLATGGVVIQVYDNQGNLLAASNPAFDLSVEGASIPPEAVLNAQDGLQNWQGRLAGRPVRAALTYFDTGFIATFTPVEYIGDALERLARALFIMSSILIAVASLAAYWLSASATRPVTELANLAAELGPERLVPIDYRGPDDEVGLLSDVLNDLISRLKVSMDAQRSFLAETSHELRTPLTSLQGFIDRATRRANPSVQRDLDDARRIAQTMSRLVADLLQLSRGELVREVVPHLLDPYLDILEPLAEEYPGVIVKGEAGDILVGDPERLRQLVRNLLANAVRATGDPGKVVLSLEQTPDSYLIEVKDEGPGIPLEVLPHIFDKFYKGPGGGAGLGLAIAKQIAEVHRGRLEVMSELGQGTTFRLWLPAIDASTEDTFG